MRSFLTFAPPRPFVLVLSAFYVFAASQDARADLCDGTKVSSCFDYCTKTEIKTIGNRCETTYDYEKECYRAKGNCEADSSYGRNPCLQKTVNCFDPCSNGYVVIRGADRCGLITNLAKSCSEARGYCSRLSQN